MAQDPRIRIDPASESDIPHILRFIRGLAEYEKLPCPATADGLRQTLFGDRPYAEALIARIDDEPVGYALFFHSYSTFFAKPGIYLEDLFVLPDHRSCGAGKALLRGVAKIARERNCGRLEWSVLDWNQPAIEFYERLGATILSDWRICRMSSEQFAALANG
jgi:GNAT superfamily N-acetyltransferase